MLTEKENKIFIKCCKGKLPKEQQYELTNYLNNIIVRHIQKKEYETIITLSKKINLPKCFIKDLNSNYKNLFCGGRTIK